MPVAVLNLTIDDWLEYSEIKLRVVYFKTRVVTDVGKYSNNCSRQYFYLSLWEISLEKLTYGFSLFSRNKENPDKIKTIILGIHWYTFKVHNI